MAVRLWAGGRGDASRLAFEEALRSRPNYGKAHNNLGYVLRKLGRLDEAIAACRTAIRLEPEDANTHFNLGHALMEKGLFADALAAVRRGQELAAGTPQAARPSAQWIRDTELLLAMDARLPAVFRGEAPLA